MIQCAILDDYQNVALQYADWTALRGRVQVRVFNEHFETMEALEEATGDCEIIVAMRERTHFDADVFARLPRLRLLASTGGRNPAIDLAAAKAAGVTVAYTGSFLSGTLEHTWALLLAAARNIPNEVANFRAGGPWQLSVGADLAERRLGIIGLGRQGSAVARVARAFNMRVSAWSQNLTEARCAEVGVEHAGSLEALLEQSDVVTIHLVLSERTRGLINAAAFERMQPHAILVTTSRGPIIDQAALVAALQQRRIAGAAIDVFEPEPVALHDALRGLDNLVATPHLAYVTEGCYRVYFQGVVENIEAWLEQRLTRILA